MITEISGGHVIDANCDGLINVTIKDNRIIQNRGHVASTSNLETFDASGCYVVSGLVDLHCHVFPGQTFLGVDPDTCCLQRGVTAVADAGSSGCNDFDTFHRNVVMHGGTKTDVYSFLHVSSEGLTRTGCVSAGGEGELHDMDRINEVEIRETFRKHADVIIGLKIRLAVNVSDDGRNELEAFEKALRMSKELNIPLMVHHALSSIPIFTPARNDHATKLSCPGSLRKGDIYTHCFHGYEPNILDPDNPSKIHPEVWKAKSRGVLFCLGHGQGSFSWTVAKVAAANGFFPDIISSDLHSDCIDGPTFDLCLCMSKMLHLGMPINAIIQAVTTNPRKILLNVRQAQCEGSLNESNSVQAFGSLSPGNNADITVFRLVNKTIKLCDYEGQVELTDQYIDPIACWKHGERIKLRTVDYDMSREKITFLKTLSGINQEDFRRWKDRNAPNHCD